MRRIASNLLFDGRQLLHNPLVHLTDEGLVSEIRTTDTPDREPFTEFYAGLLVVGLDDAVLPSLLTDHTTPLLDLLAPHTNPARGRLTHLTGLDYTALRFTPESRYAFLFTLSSS